ncbi:MAG: hypothetical protein MUE67_10620 [Anaerolineales bacterium]|jgi:hypothetical protein|nr:hypothetical protein [Anaerolineales bacterium]
MNRTSQLSETQLYLIRSYIQPGEVLRWVGCEPSSRFLCQYLLRLGLFFLWTGLAALWAGELIWLNPQFLQARLEEMLPVLASGALAGAGGFYLVREFICPARRAPDLYVITTRRALVISSCREPVVRVYGPDSIANLMIKRRKGGRGDLLFEHKVQWVTDEQGRSTHRVRRVGFFGLPAVDEVMHFLEQIR